MAARSSIGVPRIRLEPAHVPYLIGGCACVVLLLAVWGSRPSSSQPPPSGANAKRKSVKEQVAFGGTAEVPGADPGPPTAEVVPSLPAFDDYESKEVRRIVSHLVNSQHTAGLKVPAAVRTPTVARTVLPEFVPQRLHLLKEIRAAKRPGMPLLVEGAPGIGKAHSLQTLVDEEAGVRPVVFLQLATGLHKRHGGSALDGDSDAEDEADDMTLTSVSSEHMWQKALATAFGYKNRRLGPVDDDEDEDMYQVLSDITKALRYLPPGSYGKPPLLVIDDVQLLFSNHILLHERYSSLDEAFAWFLECEREQLLEVIFCSSEKSALAGLRRLKGYDWTLSYKCLEGVNDSLVVDYLLTAVNPVLPDEQKFTPELADLFVQNFGGNMMELTCFVNQRASLEAFIDERENEHTIFLSNHIPHGADETTLRDVVLQMMMAGSINTEQLEHDQCQLIDRLVEANFLRWRETKNSPGNPASMEESWTSNGAGAEVVWFNNHIQTVLQRWFNEG
ncbi:hypothetical protein HKX48_004972 [Thoreauomyces humboldtii]|nr:hypothetical protein HKX48_004972 [Thoreauomyces humboldtii]